MSNIVFCDICGASCRGDCYTELHHDRSEYHVCRPCGNKISDFIKKITAPYEKRVKEIEQFCMGDEEKEKLSDKVNNTSCGSSSSGYRDGIIEVNGKMWGTRSEG